jgi:phytoene dehydrogenase-like protein
MKHDIIIIGAGLGGLTAGAKLAKEGKKVLVIEQHSVPGGYATTFRRRDFLFEVGLHEMYGPATGDMESRIFNDLEVFNTVSFIRIPEFYRFINGRNDVNIPHDPTVAAERLCSLFPGEIDGINAFFTHLLEPRKKATESDLPDMSLGAFLDSIIRNDDLKLILLGNLGYYHDDPYSLSLAYYTAAQGSYFTGGASFIKGGSQQLSDYLMGYIRNHGGEVLLNHIVSGIITESKKAAGVLYKRKSSAATDVLEALADEIIANAAMPNVATLLPTEYGEVLKNELQYQKTGASLLTIYLGFSKPLRELGYHSYSTFIYDSAVESPHDILNNNRDDFARRNFTFVDYSQVDSALAPAGKGVGVICCIDYLDNWENLDRKAYLARKQQVALTFIQRLEQVIPGVSGIVEYQDVATPTTLKRYTLNPEGAVYGFAQSPLRKAIDTSALPDNLHFASAWGKTGGGFSGVIYSGYLCALSILRKRGVK